MTDPGWDVFAATLGIAEGFLAIPFIGIAGAVSKRATSVLGKALSSSITTILGLACLLLAALIYFGMPAILLKFVADPRETGKAWVIGQALGIGLYASFASPQSKINRWLHGLDARAGRSVAPLGSKCRDCGRTLIRTRIDTLRGTAGNVEVVFRGLPIIACPESHTRKFADRNFGNDLLNAVFRLGAIAEVGPGQVCAYCSHDVGPAHEQTIDFHLDLSVGALDRFVANVRTMGVRCENCGELQVLESAIAFNGISEAILDAFRNGRL